MIAALRDLETSIGVVRIRATSGDALSDRQRVAVLLAHTSLKARALPPSSVLVVRKMRDPMPGFDWFRQQRLRVPARWEEEAARQLDGFASVAARPALSSVPATAESVLFLDRAELLACLAMDWVHRRVRTSWWWGNFIGTRDVDSFLEQEWRAAPAYIPRALEILVSRGEAASFLQGLSEATAGSLLTTMRWIFGIVEGRSANLVEPPIYTDEDVALAEKEATPAVSPPLLATREPWLPWAPEAADHTLSPVKRAFLGQALMLRRAPAGVRSAVFQTEVASWLDSLSASWNGAASFASQAPSSARLVVRNNEIKRPAMEGANSAVANESEGSDESSAVHEKRSELIAGDIELQSYVAEVASAEDGDALAVRPSPAPTSRPSDSAAIEETETALGGIFFLLNVALQLGLYGDFSSTQCKGLDLDIWDFLSLIGGALVNDKDQADPVWKILATLACRSQDEPAGANFDAPRNWRVPRDWLEAFPEEIERHATTQGGRLRIWHPVTFLLVDEGPDEKADQGRDLERWIGWMTGYIRARLVRALGRDDAAECLIHLPARVQQTATHLEVWFSLDQYPIEIRMAGLDRDLGWIPAAGRYVAYRFE
jgi:hypothetical protein